MGPNQNLNWLWLADWTVWWSRRFSCYNANAVGTRKTISFFNGYDVDKIWMHNDHNTIYIIHILYTKLIIYSICVAWARHVGSSPKKAIYNLRTAVVLMVKHIAILGIFKLDHQQLENNLKSKYGNIHHEEIRRIFNDYELSTCLDETTHVHLFDCKHLGLETLVLSMLTAIPGAFSTNWFVFHPWWLGDVTMVKDLIFLTYIMLHLPSFPIYTVDLMGYLKL